MKNLYDEEQIKRLLQKIKEADAIYACLNYGESFCPEEIADRSICIPWQKLIHCKKGGQYAALPEIHVMNSY